jgi:hypothetical protein
MECSHLIISSVVLMLVRRGTEYFILKSRAERGIHIPTKRILAANYREQSRISINSCCFVYIRGYMFCL